VVLDYLYTAIAWVMKQWHALFSTFLPAESGITWALSIVFLVVTIRVLLFRLFVKQVKSQRAMQEIQPEIQKLRKQYGSDKQGFSTAMMALQKERGVNPLAGCLPILPQVPVFISLFHVLRRIAPGKEGLYSWDDALTDQAAKAKLFGAPISSSFNMQGDKADAILAFASYTNIRIVAMVLIVIMCVTTFTTQ
jgi:YidC/Oxa1 family membrane protein insertase